ncbi:MAG: DUF2252 domain-containing protein [Jiangellaceae bacterium]|nr:DUF2252 domain-containing protein [Jiangellaceae bacterium]
MHADSHVILETAESQAYASLRRRPVPRKDRYALGTALRQDVPRSSLGRWRPADDRVDPVQQVIDAHQDRLEWLIPVRIGRMVASPFAFLRGTAGIMAADFAQLPATGIKPVICGDAHLGNFGFYASPERDLVFDLNDFDEAHPGCWEWDLRRLVTSVWVAGRQNGAAEAGCEAAVAACVAAYRLQIARLAREPLLARFFERLDLDRLRTAASDKSLQAEIERSAQRARTRTGDRAVPRFTVQEGSARRIVEEPPLITRLSDRDADVLAQALDEYLTTVPKQWRRLLAGYTVLDTAHKVVGVGSVGLRAYVVLCEGSSPDDVVFLQIKQARRSVVARFVHGESARHVHQGQRVVEYQQALQTVSDPMLGWTTINDRQYYVRQFRDMKGAIPIDRIDAPALADYARVCGHLLAKGHARTSGASMIAGYVGSSDKVDIAMCRFARAYADQTEQDHRALVEAVRAGRLPVEHGV